MDGTILSQGRFVVATGVPVVNLNIPSAADFMYVYNYTNAGKVGAATGLGVSYYWQRGMAAGTGMVEYYGNGSAVKSGDTLVSGGFTLFDASASPVGNAVATTASTNATRPVVSTASTAGVAVGSIVRLSNTAQTDVNGVDFVVGAVTANVSFTLMFAGNALATAPGAIGGAGSYRIISMDPLYYPRRRFVVNITQALNANVGTSVPHGYVVGQKVRFTIPAVSGMIQLNSTPANNYLAATVVSVVDSYNFTIDIDSSAFTAFTWPTIAQQPSSYPEVAPVGEDSAFALLSVAAQTPIDINGLKINDTNVGVLSDSVVNTGFLGMTLGTGGVGAVAGALAISGPAGTTAADVVYWRAGKSSFGGL